MRKNLPLLSIQNLSTILSLTPDRAQVLVDSMGIPVFYHNGQIHVSYTEFVKWCKINLKQRRDTETRTSKRNYKFKKRRMERSKKFHATRNSLIKTTTF